MRTEDHIIPAFPPSSSKLDGTLPAACGLQEKNIPSEGAGLGNSHKSLFDIRDHWYSFYPHSLCEDAPLRRIPCAFAYWIIIFPGSQGTPDDGATLVDSMIVFYLRLFPCEGNPIRTHSLPSSGEICASLLVYSPRDVLIATGDFLLWL